MKGFFGLCVAASAFFVASVAAGQGQLPEGLFSADPLARIAAVEQVELAKTASAIPKLASLVRTDEHADVRRLACRALGTLAASSELPILESAAQSDPNAAVRAEAEKALRLIRREPALLATQPTGPFVPASSASTPASRQGADGGPTRSEHPVSLLRTDEEQFQSRWLGFGVGTMGGYGIAALDLRLRIPTTIEFLPVIGVEIGGGWTPPGGYQLIAGPVDDPISNESRKWKILSGGVGALFYLAREHYIPLRIALDMGQGPHGLLGYGYEQVNPEGFFSWGFEVGILVHPGIHKFIGNLVDCQAEDNHCGSDQFWPLIPYVRFTLHFYFIDQQPPPPQAL